MSKTFEQGKDEIARLGEYFGRNRETFLAAGVKEADVRQTLIDPFLEALGWDVRNTAMAAPQYREVLPEASLEVEGQQKSPDYTFRAQGMVKFYAEAKKCGVNINEDPAPAYQLRRYGWNAKVPVSILTDFEELAVYDCTIRPRPGDKASHARILYLGYRDYPQRWRELWDVFSREAVWSGSFDQYAASKRKRGTSAVDDEFLKEIEGWRGELARNIALRNRGLSPDDLNRAVQLTIDRVVFLRMAEDKGLEPYEQLLKLCERPDIYARFMRELCRRADEKYNSGLFHFQKEAAVAEDPDRVTPGLSVDDEVFRPILQGLYFAHGSPYEFKVMPVEILGTVYERFLGKVIRLTPDHRAKVEEKPQVRKAGGVYYTPAYIVDYIVKQTVARQIQGRSPMQLAGLANGRQPFSVLDMACGSGSFLLGAYQCLLEHCLKWYAERGPNRHKRAIYHDPRNGHWRLTIPEKKRILTTHIFGVDIDPQAVEVTKLSLLLKVLEGETDHSLHLGLLPFNGRALPNLAENIKCGNSLIGPDYFTARLVPDAEELKRVNPFDWNTGFPAAMQAGGFDCVIGNPPYGRVSRPEECEYLARDCSFFGAAKDTYLAFVCRAHGLLCQGGRFGYIVPSSCLGGQAYEGLRRWLLGRTIESIVVLPFDVFPDAYVDTLVLTTRNSAAPRKHCAWVYQYPKRAAIASIDPGALGGALVSQATWRDASGCKFVLEHDVAQLLGRLGRTIGARLSSHMEVRRGVLFDRAILSRRKTGPSSHRYFEGDVYRYSLRFSAPRWVEYGPRMREYPREFDWFRGRRIVLRRLVSRQRRLMASLFVPTVVTSKNLYILKAKGPEATEYALGLLNSRLFARLYLAQAAQATKDDFPQITIADLNALSFRAIDFANAAEKSAHDRMVRLVNAMLALHGQLAAAKSEIQRTVIQRQIAATDAEIDRLVYSLYGLTKEEIAIVEEAGK